ncbi:MAG: phytoene desaturase [Burkholderiales bacterium]
MDISHHSDQPHAIVIGSGFGGLAAAIRLGARGHRVTVLEKLDAPGGRAYVYKQDGFVFDGGPTIVTAPFLLDELWALCGKRLSDDVDLRAVTPFYQIRFDDGEIFNYTGDAEAMRQEIAKFSPDDVKGYERYVKQAKAVFDVGFTELVDISFADWTTMVKIAPDLLRLKSYRTVYGLVASYIKNERIRTVLSFHPLLIGGNPFTTTSILCLINHLERKWGVHFAMGGTGKIVEGLTKLIEGQGNTLRMNAEVESIQVAGRRATGVVMKSGEVIKADLVVSNADAAWTYRKMIEPEHRHRWTNSRIEKSKYSMSLFVWYFGTKRQYPDVEHHTILLGPRYKELLTDIFKNKVVAEDFSLYLHRPTATDSSLAPPGCDAFYVLSPVPHLGSGTDWREKAEPYRKSIERYLSKTVLPGLENQIASSMMLTPQDFQDRLNSVNGAAFSLEPILTQSAWFRPHNKSEELDNLYLVGAGTHPGAGLPGVIASAKVLDRVVPHGSTMKQETRNG